MSGKRNRTERLNRRRATRQQPADPQVAALQQRLTQDRMMRRRRAEAEALAWAIRARACDHQPVANADWHNLTAPCALCGITLQAVSPNSWAVPADELERVSEILRLFGPELEL